MYSYSVTPSPPLKIHHTPEALYYVKPMSDISNKRQRRQHTTIYKNTMQFHVSKFLLYKYLVL